MTDKELLQQALDTLKADKDHASYESGFYSTCAAIEERLAQPDSVLFTKFKYQDYAWFRDDNGKLKVGTMPIVESKFNPDWDQLAACKECLQEYMEEIKKLKKEWLVLTDDELSDAYNLHYEKYFKNIDYVDFLLIYKAVEAKLKEKNNA